MPAKPNVVLICVDQWRGDCLSSAGHPVVHTPYLDRMAAGGARCNRAYSATPTCIPARAALFTGLTQRTHGRVGYEEGIPWDYPITIASEFTRQGYQTQAVGKMHVHPARHRVGFDNVILHDGFVHYQRHGCETDFQQFDDYIPWLRLRAGSEADHIDHGVDCNSHIARPWDKAEQLHPTNYVASESIDFLRRRDPTQPFFLYMSFHRPHPPFDPPAWALDQYLNAAMPEVPQGNWMEDYAEHRDDFGVTASVARLRPDIQQRCRAGYFGHMTHIDHQLNRFIEALANYDLKKNTVLCFVSDHGELLGDHDLWHKRLPYEGSARIPMIFEGPGIRAGLVLEQPMELRDIMPTLLDCAGLEVPACVEGKSAFPILRGVKRDGENWREYLHGEHTGFGGSAHYLTDGREKYVWLSWSSREQLFDLRNDPQELHDLGRDPAHAARLAVWRERLMKELDGREEGFVKDGKLTVTRDVPAVQRHLLERTRPRT